MRNCYAQIGAIFRPFLICRLTMERIIRSKIALLTVVIMLWQFA
jgi:hypothetical protein